MKTNSNRVKSLSLVLLGAAAIVTANTAMADDSNRRLRQQQLHNQTNQAWNNLTPEQQQNAKAAARQGYDTLSPKAKAAWHDLSPEQQDAAIARAKNRGKTWGQGMVEDQQALSQDQRYDIRNSNRATRQSRRQ